jgi:hypothetical protein
MLNPEPYGCACVRAFGAAVTKPLGNSPRQASQARVLSPTQIPGANFRQSAANHIIVKSNSCRAELEVDMTCGVRPWLESPATVAEESALSPRRISTMRSPRRRFSQSVLLKTLTIRN